MQPKQSIPPTTRPGRPEGGFHILSTRQLCAAWSAYRLGLLGGFLAFRVYLALHEVAERRQAAALRSRRPRRSADPHPRRFRPMVDEVERLVGGAGGRCLRRAVRRLAAVGLVRYETPGLVLVDDPLLFAPRPVQEAARAMLSRIHASPRVRERPLAVPRRLLRHLARPGSPTAAATLLGHALRCLWRRGDDHRLIGSCSSDFIARVFGVHVRTVKTARHTLQVAGWLRSIPAPRWHVQRFGGRWAITPPRHPRVTPLSSLAGPESPLPPPAIGTESPPPESKRSLPSEVQQPEPALRRALVSARGRKESSPPSLRHVQPVDLRDDARLSCLLRQAVARRWLSGAEADRLRGFAAAEHALRIGTRNPAGLFVWMLRRQCWGFLATADEDRARERLRRPDTPRETEDVQTPAGCEAVAALVERIASALSLTSRLEREKACTASAKPAKNTTVGSSPQHAASSLMTRMASNRNSTLSAKAPRNTARCSPSVMRGVNADSMPAACHILEARSLTFPRPDETARWLMGRSPSGRIAAA